MHWKCVSYLLFVSHHLVTLSCSILIASSQAYSKIQYVDGPTKQEGGDATDILLLASAPVDLVFRNRVDGLGTEPLVSGHTFPSRHVAGSCYYQRYFASISSHGFQLFLDPFESVTDKLVVPQ